MVPERVRWHAAQAEQALPQHGQDRDTHTATPPKCNPQRDGRGRMLPGRDRWRGADARQP